MVTAKTQTQIHPSSVTMPFMGHADCACSGFVPSDEWLDMGEHPTFLSYLTTFFFRKAHNVKLLSFVLFEASK